jgi:hypothetical protein
MYREVLAFHVRQERPHADVVLASSQTLRNEAKRMRPHLIFANEVPPELKEKDCFWVELHTRAHTGERLDADIRADGYSTTIHDVSLQNLLAVVDKAEEELAHYDDE